MLGFGMALNRAKQFYRIRTATGNSLSLSNTINSPAINVQVKGETQGLKVVFTTTTVITTGADFPFSNGATITFSGLATTANNKAVAVTTVSGKTMTFPSATFTAATETVGSMTDGTLTYAITVSPANPQTLTSVTNFDYTTSNADASESVTATISLKDTLDAQLENRGIPLTYNIDGSVATYSARDLILKKTDGKWYLQKNVEKVTSINAISIITDKSGWHSAYVYPADFIPATIKASTTKTICNKLKDVTASVITEVNTIVSYSANQGKLIGIPDTLTGIVGSDTDAQKKTKFKNAFNAGGFEFYAEIATPTYTELCAADQTALNAIEHTYQGTTNISLSTALGQVVIIYRASK